MGYTKDYEPDHIGLYKKILFKLCLCIKIYVISHFDIWIYRYNVFSLLDYFPSGRCTKKNKIFFLFYSNKPIIIDLSFAFKLNINWNACVPRFFDITAQTQHRQNASVSLKDIYANLTICFLYATYLILKKIINCSINF